MIDRVWCCSQNAGVSQMRHNRSAPNLGGFRVCNMTKRFVITGCGRSGTTFSAELLTRLGCPCVHEQYFGVKKPPRIVEQLAGLGLLTMRWKMPPYGEAAWQAAALLPLLPRDLVVFHQVRHPLDYIRSRHKKGWIHGRTRHRRLRHLPRLGQKDFGRLPLAEQVDLVARFWVDWNELLEARVGERTYFRYRVEDMDVELVRRMLDMIEFPCERSLIEQTLRILPTNVNTRGEKREDITLDLIAPATRERVLALAQRYGYALDGIDGRDEARA